MDMFKDKSELIPVTTGDLNKNENLGSELCRTVLAEPFNFFLNTCKNASC